MAHNQNIVNHSEPYAGWNLSPFQLSAGRFLSSKIPIEIVAPRPDIERSSNSRYSFAHTEIEYEVPIVVLGGAYPFKYEIVSSGGSANTDAAMIGETRQYNIGVQWFGSTNQRNYGVLRWTPASDDNGNTYSFDIRVTDQEGSTATVTISGEVDNSKFLFVDNSAGSGGDGSRLSPFQDTGDYWTGAESDSTHAGKFVYLRYGTGAAYSAFAHSTWHENRPRALMRYPGDDRPLFDGNSKDYLFNGDADDFWFSGIYVNGSEGTLNGDTASRFLGPYSYTQQVDRWMIWDNYFKNGQCGTTTNNNSGWIVIGESGASNYYMSIVGNTFDGLESGFCAYTMYDMQKRVVENNVVLNNNQGGCFNEKESIRNVSIRSNYGHSSSAQIINAYNESDAKYQPENQEVIWNFFKDVQEIPVQFNAGIGITDITNQHAGRNTYLLTANNVKAAVDWRSREASNTEDFTAIGDMIVAANAPWLIRNGSTPLDANGSTDSEANAFLTNGNFDSQFSTSASDFIDSTTLEPTGSGDAYRGTYGAVIA